jgi:RNA polymerase sigma-70 factor (ECF subfamily)
MADSDSTPSVRDEATPPQSFEKFVDAHYRAAYGFAYNLCGNHNDACDITQQAFYLAQTRAHQLRDDSKRKQWLFTILHREFLRDHRRQASHPEVNLELSEPALPHITVDHATALDSKDLRAALQMLDEGHRTPVVLFYFNQLSYKEIADVLEVPIGTVMSRLARGKQILRQKLEEGAGSKSVPRTQNDREGQNGG